MERRTFFLMAASSAAAIVTGALARPDDRGGHRGDRGRDDWSGRDHKNWRDDRGNWHNDHDRYWRPDFGQRRYVNRDRIFLELRRRRYTRFSGDPYWFQGRYVVKTYDRWGRLVYVEINPYTGAFIGVVRF
jgi:hypothetical protein